MAGTGAGAEIRDKVGVGAENKQFHLRNLIKMNKLWRPAKRTKKSPNHVVINAGDYYDYYGQSVLICHMEQIPLYPQQNYILYR